MIYSERASGTPTRCPINAVTGKVKIGRGSHMSGYATSMIGLCQEGKSSPDALRRSAGVIPFRFFAACMLASRPWFLFQIEPDFHLLTQLFAAAQKIDFVFSRQSRNLSMGALEACASSPSRVNGKTRQATHRKNPPYSLPRSTQRCCCSSLLVENSAAHDRRP